MIKCLLQCLVTTEQLHFHVSLSCIGEGNGNPLQCSCLENPRDGGACWAAVYGVAQSRTRLKRLSSSSVWYMLSGQLMLVVATIIGTKVRWKHPQWMSLSSELFTNIQGT